MLNQKNRLKRLAAGAAAVLLALGLAACGQSQSNNAQSSAASPAAESSQAESSQAESSSEAQSASASGAEEVEHATAVQNDYQGTTVRIGSLKGPTTMGLVNMMEAGEIGALPFDATFTMGTTPDEITAKIVSGDVDIALIPANLASVLYNKTNGGIEVMNINTLGVLYGVTGDSSVTSLQDLAGKTVYMTGQGATPEYAFNYILEQNGLKDKVQVEFKSEATEIAALMKEDPTKIAILPQPFATVVEMQNDGVKEFMNLTDEWAKCKDSGDSQLVTAVTVVRKEFADAHKDDGLLSEFLAQQEKSTEQANQEIDTTAELVAKYGIIEKAPVAKIALPKCGIVCLTDEEMKSALTGYLEVLFNADAKSVGGTLPGDDFYLLGV